MDSAAARRNNPKESAAAGGAAGGQIVCNGPYCEYFRVKRDEPKWLETAVYVDHSVVAFHGRETVKQYVLTLLNIVSAIYGDPTLGANLKFVILRLVFYEDPAAITSPIVEDDSKVKRGGGGHAVAILVLAECKISRQVFRVLYFTSKSNPPL